MFGKENKINKDLDVFAIYDTKVENYGDPMFSINEHDFTRQVVNTFRDPSQKQNKYLINAEDYQIFKIGSYERKSGTIVPVNPKHIANMHELKAVAFRDVGIDPT